MAVDDAAAAHKPRVFYLWAEHQDVLAVWLACRTQWRTGFAGAIGLDYAGVEAETLVEWTRQRRADEQRARRH